MKLAKSEIIQVESKKRITKTCEELKMIFEDKIGGLQQDVLSLKKSVNSKEENKSFTIGHPTLWGFK